MDQSNRLRQIILLALGCSLLLVAPVPLWAQDEETTEQPVASVSGIDITQAEWDELVSTDFRLVSARSRSRQRIERGITDILRNALLTEALERHLRNSDAIDESEIDERLAAAESAALYDMMMTRGVANQFRPSEEDVQAEVESRLDSTGDSDLIVVKQIYFALSGLSDDEAEIKRTEAMSVLAAVQASPERFDLLMLANSDSEEQGPIGPLRHDRIHDVLRDPIWSSEVGEITDILESPAGLHIFMVVRRDLAVSRASLNLAVTADLREAMFETWMSESRLIAAEEQGLEFHALPDVIDVATSVVSGRVDIAGATVLDALDLDPSTEVSLDEAAEAIERIRDEVLFAAMAREGQWLVPVDLNEALTKSHRDTIWEIADEVWRSQVAEVTDEDIEAYYSENAERYIDHFSIQVRDLELRPGRQAESGERFALHEIREQAEDLRAQWEAGADFTALVEEYSTAAEGEERVYRVSSRNDTFRLHEAVAELATGEVSAPFRLRDGYRLLQVMRTQSPWQIPLEDVVDPVRNMLATQRLGEARGQWETSIVEDLEINVTDEMIDLFYVAPPAPPATTTEEAASPEAS